MVAVNLYRADYEVSVPGSKPSEMGLPPYPLNSLLSQRCPEHPKPGWPYIQLWQTMMRNPKWAQIANEHGGNLPMIVDINHRNQGKPSLSPYFPKFGILICLDTHVTTRFSNGDADLLTAWLGSNK